MHANFSKHHEVSLCYIFTVMSKLALNHVHADFNKHHEVSPYCSHELNNHFWREIRIIYVTKCPPYSSHQSGKNRGLTLRLCSTLIITIEQHLIMFIIFLGISDSSLDTVSSLSFLAQA